MVQAVNNFVFIKRSDTEEEIGGLILPEDGKVKPSHGELISVGANNSDKNIKKSRQAFFPQGVGWEMEVDGETLLVMEVERIFGVSV